MGFTSPEKVFTEPSQVIVFLPLGSELLLQEIIATKSKITGTDAVFLFINAGLTFHLLLKRKQEAESCPLRDFFTE